MNILKIVPMHPWPLYPGQMKLSSSRSLILRKKGFKVILLSISLRKISNKEYKKLKEIFSEVYHLKISPINFLFNIFRSILLRILRNQPIQSNLFNHFNFKRAIYKIKKQNKNNIFVHFYTFRSFCFWEAVQKEKNYFCIDLIDSYTKNFSNKLKNKFSFSNIFYLTEYIAIRSFETKLPNFSNLKSYIYVSPDERKFFKAKNNPPILFYNSSIGVETKDIQKSKNKTKKHFDIIFFGSLYYEPNITGIEWFVKEILPILLKEFQNLRICIAGRDPVKKIKSLVIKNKKHISLIPNPKDMHNLIQSSSISICPIISGSGQQLKILDSIKNHVPVVSTLQCSNSLGMTNKLNILASNDPREFSEMCSNLLQNKELYNFIELNAFKFLKNNYSWDSKVEGLISNIYSLNK